LEGKGTVKVSDAKDDEDEEMGDDDEEPMKMCCMILEGGYTLFEIEKEERPEGTMVGSKNMKSVNLDIEVDWAMISDDEAEVALMPMEIKEDSGEGFVTVGEEEESVDLSKGAWGQCPECNSKGPLGLLCSRCKGTGMIYNGPCFFSQYECGTTRL
jgi:hypothetical protein